MSVGELHPPYPGLPDLLWDDAREANLQWM